VASTSSRDRLDIQGPRNDIAPGINRAFATYHPRPGVQTQNSFFPSSTDTASNPDQLAPNLEGRYKPIAPRPDRASVPSQQTSSIQNQHYNNPVVNFNRVLGFPEQASYTQNMSNNRAPTAYHPISPGHSHDVYSASTANRSSDPYAPASHNQIQPNNLLSTYHRPRPQIRSQHVGFIPHASRIWAPHPLVAHRRNRSNNRSFALYRPVAQLQVQSSGLASASGTGWILYSQAPQLQNQPNNRMFNLNQPTPQVQSQHANFVSNLSTAGNVHAIMPRFQNQPNSRASILHQPTPRRQSQHRGLVSNISRALDSPQSAAQTDTPPGHLPSNANVRGFEFDVGAQRQPDQEIKPLSQAGAGGDEEVE